MICKNDLTFTESKYEEGNFAHVTKLTSYKKRNKKERNKRHLTFLSTAQGSTRAIMIFRGHDTQEGFNFLLFFIYFLRIKVRDGKFCTRNNSLQEKNIYMFLFYLHMYVCMYVCMYYKRRTVVLFSLGGVATHTNKQTNKEGSVCASLKRV